MLEEQWKTQINLAKDALLENGIGEVELRKWEEQQKEKFQVWKEPLIIAEDTE